MTVTKRWIVLGLLLCLPVSLWAGPKIQSWTTEGGAKVMFVQAPELPMIDVRVVFDAGSARDGDKPGIATLTNALLSEGAGPWSADELAERLDDVGAQLGSSARRDMGYVSVRTLTESEAMSVSLEALAKILAEPRFEETDFERQRQQMLIALSKQKENPGTVASKTFYKAIYGDHPYGHDPMGEKTSVEALTRDDVIAFHRQYYVAANAVVAIVGDLDREQAERVAEDVVGGLPSGEHAPPLPAVDTPSPNTEQVSFDASQTHLRIGTKGMARLDTDYFPLYVGNHVLGGNGLVSQLSNEVREKRGLSYSVYSYFLPMRSTGPFLMGASTRNDRADLALEVIRQTLTDFMADGPTDQELDEAKRNITGGFPLRVSSNKKIVEYIAMMGFYDYPLDYLDTFVDRVNAVSREDILRAYRSRIDPEKLLVVAVGGS